MKSGTTVVMGDGSVRVIDPSISHVDFMRGLDPDFEILSDPPKEDYRPGFDRLRSSFIGGMERDELQEMSTDMIWAVHDAAMEGRIPLQLEGDVNVLDLKIELGERILEACDLCGRQCRKNRYDNPGACGARNVAVSNGIFEHICEESPLNPAWNVILASCPMACAFCQAPENRMPGEGAENLGSKIWERIMKSRTAKTLEFVGGEPAASCPGILKFLSIAPKGFRLPVVMNSNAFLGKSAVRLMNGAVDVWLPDFTFGNDNCAKRLSGVDRYWETATEAISLMSRIGGRTIVRMLILPGHFDCCHKRVLDYLARYRDVIWVSIMDQYLPLHQAFRHKDINRLPSDEELSAVKDYSRIKGLRDINDEIFGAFWK